MKKRLILTAMAVIMTVTVAVAQQIAVVSEGGETSVYQTFQTAIEGADPGSVIYLPGGNFTLPDSVKITKKLTIIGVGHKAKTDVVDGNTVINGNLFLNEGSSSSAVMGCYITGRVKIGENGIVNNVLIKQCFLNGIDVLNKDCTGTIVNQNYVVDRLIMGDSNAIIKNNIVRWTNTGYGPCIYNVGSGIIQHNILLHGSQSMAYINATVTDNVITAWEKLGSGTMITSGNMGFKAYGENAIVIEAENGWDDVFVNYNNGRVSTESNFHFKEAFIQYENQVGIYAGTGFSDDALPPVPYIVAKRIAEETDAAGQLKIQVRVKSGE